MGTETGIEWTDHTFNPWWGCTKVSPGCAHCYAERDSNRYGNDLWGPGKARKTFGLKHWNEPLRWNAAAIAEGRRHRVFCASMADVFEEEAPAAELARLWDLIRATPALDWQLLTKRPHLIASKLPADWGDGYANVWLGTSVEDQKRADERIPHLCAVPARVRFLSCEPLLGPVDLLWPESMFPGGPARCCDGRECGCHGQPVDPWLAYGIHWIIAGGESGSSARPAHPAWIRRLRDDAATIGAAFFFKQWGEHAPGYHNQVSNTGRNEVWVHRDGPTCAPHADARHDSPRGWDCMIRVGKKAAGSLLDGVAHKGMPS